MTDGIDRTLDRDVHGALLIALAELVDHDLALALERRVGDRRAAEADAHGLDRQQLVEMLAGRAR